MMAGRLTNDNVEVHNAFVDVDKLDEIARLKSVLFGVRDENVCDKEVRDMLTNESINYYFNYLESIKGDIEMAIYNQDGTEMTIKY